MKRLIFLAIWVCVLDVANAERIMCIVEESVLCQAGQCKEIYQEGGYATVIDTDLSPACIPRLMWIGGWE